MAGRTRQEIARARRMGHCAVVQLRSLVVVVTVVFASVAVVGGGALGSACVDPCLFSGNACNVTSDCEGSQVCIHAGPDDAAACALFAGVCGDGDCGSDDDCDFGCCDITERACVMSSFNCVSRECDVGSFEGPPERPCGDDQACEDGRCVDECDDDFDCPGDARCIVNCTADIGERCTPDLDSCFGGSCVDENFNGQSTEPYCTATCFDFDIEGSRTSCPTGFACEPDTNDCLRLE